MGLKSRLKKQINCEQIKALLWKDVLVRCRQPWMTTIQYIWPCLIFVALYALRLKFEAVDIDVCQYPTRQLPSPSGLLPFFQSYICTIDNECSNVSDYHEVSEFDAAPVTPIVNVVQTFLNEDKLYHAIVDLPENMNFLGAITTIATHPKFSVLEANIAKLLDRVNSNGSPIDSSFDINGLWSDGMTFSKAGSVLCGKPFPHSSNIRIVDRVFYQEDFNGANQDELDAMPTKYCKQLYLDVTSTNNGKITWNYIKPIIQGKILYGPVNARTEHIMKNANDTLIAMNRLKNLIKGLSTTIQKLRVEGEFKKKFMNLVQLAHSPFVQGLLGSFNVNGQVLDTIFDALLHDKQVADITETIANIFECFSVDRFVGVKSEKELEDMAVEMNKKKLFLAGIFFDNDGHRVNSSPTDYAYKLRMDIDNTPVTLENRNRLWFPGADGNFELQMRYHRGFIQIQHIVDQAITKTIVELENERLEEEWKCTTTVAPTSTTSIWDDYEDDEEEVTDAGNGKSATQEVTTSPTDTETTLPPQSIPEAQTTSTNDTQTTVDPNEIEQNGNSTSARPPQRKPNDISNEKPQETNDSIRSPDTNKKRRKKRSPQFNFLDLLSGESSSAKPENSFDGGIKLPDQGVYTKQFPYPKYRKDSFVLGLYLAQSIQLAFFFALIIHVSAAVRNRIWMRESGNSTLMRIMGLERTSENISWMLTTLVEIAIVFLLCEIILYSGGILQTSNPFVLYLFLLTFAFCVIAFCYMISTFFSSASIGSVSAVILFLMTYMPYIVIIALGTTLSTCSKFLASLSISTAFCYAWHYILRLELQQRELTFSNAFEGSFESNDFKFGVTMIVIDLILYTAIGYLYERFTNDEFKFHNVPTKDMDIGIGGALHNCTKKYDSSERAAIDNVSMVFRRDYITCLLGRNGAGKSTIIKLLTGQIAPSAGHVFWPQNWDRISGNEFDDRIGLCPQNNILIPNLTAKEHLQLYVRIKSNGNDSNNRREVERVMRSLQFGKHEHFYSQSLSGGFKRRLNVAIAFIASPNLVILDEPCSGVDTKARRNIWDLISALRKGRAVVLATHYLDEAEHLSDSILILNEGKVMVEHDPDTLKDKFTRSFELQIKLRDGDKTKTVDELKQLVHSHAPESNVMDVNNDSMSVSIPYRTDKSDYINYAPLIKDIEHMESEHTIRSFRIISSNLDQIFNDLVLNRAQSGNGIKKIEDKVVPIIQKEKLSEFEVMTTLLKKRFLHFKRNYRLILTVLVLPTIFEIIAMGFMTLRPPGEHDINLRFSRELYPNTTEFYSLENGDDYQSRVYENLYSQCKPDGMDTCAANSYELFNSSQRAFKWILDTQEQYVESRYGGASINASRSAVWYNNKGYHSMPVYLNQLNTANLQTAMNNTEYRIFTNNHPLKLGEKELTTTSILQQVADAGISLILLVAFSLVIAGASVYIVTERLNGEKLQQKLCGVSFKTYWGVSFVWDYTVFIIALLLAIVVFKWFDIPVYTAKDNLYGIVVLLLLFGFATIPMVHLFEKLFTDASLANMYMLCMNIIIALMTVTVVILFDVLGESDESERIRDFLNRAFLVLPQHALADGLVEICKNYILAEVFERYYINTYKSPVASDLLLPHFSALIGVAIVFIVANYVIESGRWRSWVGSISKKRKDHDLDTITTVQQNGFANDAKKYDLYNHSSQPNAMEVENLSKTYDGHNQALRNVTFNVKSGECFGLLGANGAGKSTIFGILSSQLAPTSGTVQIENRDSGISYCPQTNALDNLLTTTEIIYFYAKLRRIQNVTEIIEQTLETYHLLPYRNVLVKNLSGGNRRKLSVAVACFGSTSNVLMDEPTSDMDPITRSIVYASINRLLYEKRSVILTSHTITEIDRVCGRIGLLRQGEMIVVAPPQQLKMMYGNCYSITIYFDQIEALTIEREVKKINGAENVIVHSHCLQFRIKIKSPASTSYNNNNNSTSKILSEIEIASSVASAALGDGMVFSDLINTLHALSVDRGISYTITECLLDQAFDRVLEADAKQHSYSNGAYQSETPT